MGVLDRVMHDKVSCYDLCILRGSNELIILQHKKPSLMQRLTKSGLNRGSMPISVGEQIVKEMMRKRAGELAVIRDLNVSQLTGIAHYVEARDDIEIKVAKINGRLMQLMQEGEKVC